MNLDPATGHVRLPQGDFLHADFTRSGPDLLIETADGGAYVVPDYFMAEISPPLITHKGMMLSAKVVTALAGPLAPGMVAQAAQAADGVAPPDIGLGEPIGQISESEGQVSVTHANGTKAPLATGDNIFQGDILETATAANVSVIFVDDTIFSLDEDARMVMDEMVYDPDTQSGVFNAQVVQGVFSFVSGQVAKTSPDGMVVQTPTSTIGIRGSTGGGKAGAEGQENTITLVPDVDGNVGEFIITTAGGTLTLNSAGATTTTFSANAAPSAVIILSPAQIQQSFGASLTKLVQVVA
ncbi:MAG: FecR domain-containing protein, partial [Rhodospirillales bacterium]|nr:FecR domain-containing protein [Rhodospirillales bacterium]